MIFITKLLVKGDFYMDTCCYINPAKDYIIHTFIKYGSPKTDISKSTFNSVISLIIHLPGTWPACLNS